MKKVYFIGIAGKTMGHLAKAFKDLGWDVSGSDHKGIYPPISTYLKENKIKYFGGYETKNVPPEADLVVVGRSALMVDANNPEYLQAKKLNLLVLSYPEVLQKYLVKKNSIVVAGTYGKTTISSLVAWILINAGLNPSYMTGGMPLNVADGVKITDSEYSVVEGDEPPALFPDDPPKFMFYNPKYLLLTATKWDHPEIYKSEEAYLKAFIDLVRLLPKDGLLVYNLDNVSEIVLKEAKCRKVSYSLQNPKADYHYLSVITLLLGEANRENICGAAALCTELKIENKIILKSVATFKGVKTRLEFLGKFSNRTFYWDFAQHPEKVKGSLEALREKFSRERIICVFDPVMTGLKYKESLKWYPGTFDLADVVVVGKVGYLREVKGKDRVTGTEIINAISQTQKNVFYQPIDDKIFEYLVKETKLEDVIIFMSSGGLRFTNLISKVIAYFKPEKSM